jgi:hypothetical protein
MLSQAVILIRPVLLYYVVEKLVTPDELWADTYIVRRTALQIWQISNSVTITTNVYPIGTLIRFASNIMDRRSC